MFESHFGLNGAPFQLSPDPGFYFASTGHGNALAYMKFGAYQGEGFENVGPGESAGAEVGKIAGDGEDEHELDPLGGLELHGAESNPAARTQGLVADAGDKHRSESHDEEAVDPGNEVDELVVVNFGKNEHRHDAAGEQ